MDDKWYTGWIFESKSEINKIILCDLTFSLTQTQIHNIIFQRLNLVFSKLLCDVTHIPTYVHNSERAVNEQNAGLEEKELSSTLLNK